LGCLLSNVGALILSARRRVDELEFEEALELAGVIASVLDATLRTVAQQVVQQVERFVHHAPESAAQLYVSPHVIGDRLEVVVREGGSGNLGEERA
jgi:hypothetical protein